MINYGKLDTHGNLERLRGIRGVFNPSPDRLAAYAAANSFKPLEDTPQPNQYYIGSWEDAGDKIKRIWTPIELEAAKDMAREVVQAELSQQITMRVEVDCPALDKSIIYDEAALINAMGLEAGDIFIAADDSLHELDGEKITAIKAALKGYRAGLYAAATEKRAAIAAAESVDDLVTLGY